ncbi:hypothetical protein F53441_10131 [Fusarium austroafricanum]|uniref:Uncharacterized protein n=1 Tax=Fusarium austroafricanum TaxID=2364996 RepID=A0A8H4K7K1_9HYPO|nr:hypothetical protein F53441_10131 [Fusarium austroafricanum]
MNTDSVNKVDVLKEEPIANDVMVSRDAKNTPMDKEVDRPTPKSLSAHAHQDDGIADENKGDKTDDEEENRRRVWWESYRKLIEEYPEPKNVPLASTLPSEANENLDEYDYTIRIR